jgi:ribosomal protein L11 methyltransferase
MKPLEPNGSTARKDWQLLTLEGTAEQLEACLGLLTPWTKGAQAAVQSEGPASRLELYIDISDRQSIEQAWADWEQAAIPAVSDVSRDWSVVPPEAWHLEWRDHFPPLKVTANITIVPDWDRTTTAPLLIRLHPGMAFGTGHHATTQLMIRRLEQLGCGGQRVLDLGAGSGVLSIAALLLGAEQVVAVEQDPVCEDNFMRNLELNRQTGRADFVPGDAGQWTNFDFDLVLANIQRSVIMEILNNFAPTDSCASLILSGLQLEDETGLLEYCRRYALNLEHIEREQEWLCAVASR